MTKHQVIDRKRYKAYFGFQILERPSTTGTFLVYQYCWNVRYLRSLEHAGVFQKLTILEHKNGLILPNNYVPVSGT